MKKQFFKKNYLYSKEDLTPFKRVKEFVHTAWTIKKEWLLYKNAKRYFGDINPKDWITESRFAKSRFANSTNQDSTNQDSMNQDSESNNNNQNVSITWIGHSTFLIQVGKINILTDPNFSDSILMCPRNFRPGIELHNLPRIDHIILSHNHADHCDFKSFLSLKKHEPKIFVPFGDKRYFSKLNIKDKSRFNVQENDWWQENIISDDLKFTFLPAIHWSGRSLLDINKSLWGSWLIEYKNQKIYFAGDTAYAGHFLDIAKKYNSIDVALLPIAPEEPRKCIDDSHMGCEQAVQAFLDLGAKSFIPTHWGTFRSSADNFYGPILKLKKSWKNKIQKKQNKNLYLPKVGELINFNS